MWVILKFITAACAFFYRWYQQKIRMSPDPDFEHTVDGVTCHITPLTHKGTVKGTVLTLDLKSSAVFKLSSETYWDRFFKKIGLSNEVQTGDAEFDDDIYVACDSAAFSHEIRNDEETRRLVVDLFSEKAEYIEADGKTISIAFPGDKTEKTLLKNLAIALQRRLSDMDRNFVGSRFDYFFFKALAIECLIWSLGAYAALSFMEWQVEPETIHLDPIALASRGIAVGILIAIALLGLIAFLLKGSSRSHRIIVECALILGFSLPMGGIAIFSDINTRLDEGTPVWAKRGIYESYRTVHRGRKGRTWYSYHIILKAPEATESIQIPRTLEISEEEYRQAKNKTVANLEIMPGRLKLPWLRAIVF